MSRMRRPAPCPRGHAALCPPTLAARWSPGTAGLLQRDDGLAAV